jgi:DNA-binding MarR family transcriptional regulator
VVILVEKENMHFIMLNNKIFRNIQIYLDRVLKKYELSSGSCPYLFNLENHEGIGQNQISKKVRNDKAMSARTITKLIEQGYVFKKPDDNHSSAYNLYLTEKAKAILPAIHEEIQLILNLITEDLTPEEITITMRSLIKILDSTQKLRE